MKIATTQSERLALIKEIAQRKKKLAFIKKKSNVSMLKMKAAAKPMRSFAEIPDDSSKNPNYYTDASKYAGKYYGDIFRETTKFDSPFSNGDWD